MVINSPTLRGWIGRNYRAGARNDSELKYLPMSSRVVVMALAALAMLRVEDN